MNIVKRQTTGKRGRPAKVQNLTPVPSIIDFSQITKLNKLDIDNECLNQCQQEYL
jgi:hypothetical protein